MAATDLTTLAAAKAWLKLPSGTFSDDAVITALVTSVSSFLQSTLDRIFGQVTYVEYRNGKNTHSMMVKDYPLSAVTSVTVDNIAIPLAADSTQPGYLWDDKSISLVNGYYFTKGIQNVQLVYTAGYSPIPTEIAQVAIDLIAKKYRQRDRIGLKSEIIQGQTVSFDVNDLNDEIKSVLKQYTKVVPV